MGSWSERMVSHFRMGSGVVLAVASLEWQLLLFENWIAYVGPCRFSIEICGIVLLRLHGAFVSTGQLFSNCFMSASSEVGTEYFTTESLILAQNERWRRGLGMQVEREAFASILRERSEGGQWRKGE